MAKRNTDTLNLKTDYKGTDRASRFFSGYRWCLNPILTFNDLLIRMENETDRFFEFDAGWERDECRINIYLFSCAIACTLADFLARRPWRLLPLAQRIPSLKKPVLWGEALLNLPAEVKARLEHRKLWDLKDEWNKIVEQASRLILLKEEDSTVQGKIHTGNPELVRLCQKGLQSIRSLSLPPELLKARMKPNEGFRCQDLSPYDVKTLALRFLDTNPPQRTQYVVIGSRTAGSYLAPLLKINLEYLGFNNVNWITVRPKTGLCRQEKKTLEKLLSGKVHVLLIDDYANTGNTFRLLEGITNSYGVPGRNITKLAPVHPVVEARYSSLNEIKKVLSGNTKTQVITLHNDDLYLTRLMEPPSVESLLNEVMTGGDIKKISVTENSETEDINAELWKHYPDSFQVRLKRVYEIEIFKNDGRKQKRKVLAKSVGAGWFGYHAYLSGKALNDWVPGVTALREGVLFMDWIEGKPLSSNEKSVELLERMSAYLAQRSKKLDLEEDPRSNRPFLGWGWLEILAILRHAYHHLLGYLKYDYLLRRLKESLHSIPVLVDGRMRPDEWLQTQEDTAGNYDVNKPEQQLVKVDFEHHNFGAPELDVVDPAYDLAITSFEFQLNESEESRLVERYADLSGDRESLQERVFLYKLLYAKTQADRSLHRLDEAVSRDQKAELNRRIQWCWNFSVFSMNRFCASLMRKVKPGATKPGVFFLDIDGVLDIEKLGFPHTTVSGLTAISLLRSNGFVIVPNTGRSCSQVRNLCSSYGFDAGIGEYGSILVDASGNQEYPLINQETANELNRFREIIKGKEDVFTDSNYRCAVRVFRYTSGGTSGLKREEAINLLKEYGFEHLKVITREADTYFVGKINDKGSAIDHYKKHFGYYGDLTAAAGDSDEDVEMLEKVRYPFAPANCSKGIRRASKQGKCKIVRGEAQRGLLQIAVKLSQVADEDVVGKKTNGSPTPPFIKNYDENSFQHLMLHLLRVAELPRFKRILSLFM